MPLTRDFKETVKARLRRDPKFRAAFAAELKALKVDEAKAAATYLLSSPGLARRSRLGRQVRP
jgi:hypothetical protein